MDRMWNKDIRGPALDRCFRDKARQKLDCDHLHIYWGGGGVNIWDVEVGTARQRKSFNPWFLITVAHFPSCEHIASPNHLWHASHPRRSSLRASHNWGFADFAREVGIWSEIGHIIWSDLRKVLWKATFTLVVEPAKNHNEAKSPILPPCDRPTRPKLNDVLLFCCYKCIVKTTEYLNFAECLSGDLPWWNITKNAPFGFMALMVGVGWGVLCILQMVNLLLLLLHWQNE